MDNWRKRHILMYQPSDNVKLPFALEVSIYNCRTAAICDLTIYHEDMPKGFYTWYDLEVTTIRELCSAIESKLSMCQGRYSNFAYSTKDMDYFIKCLATEVADGN